jgi:hypothetical protein
VRKQTIFALACLSLVLVSVLSLPQGFARAVKDHSPNPPQYSYVTVGAVSSSTGGCTNLELSGFFGDVLVTRGELMMGLIFANPSSSTFTVSVAQIKANGACDGTWKSLGSINTDQAGRGELIQKDGLTSGSYVFEFRDSAGNLAYATSSVSL